MWSKKPKLNMLIRIIYIALTGTFFVYGLFWAKTYSESTYGCGPGDYIAPDTHMAIITLIISLIMGILFFINLAVLFKLKTKPNLYTKYWFQTILVAVLFGGWFVEGFFSPHAWAGWCLF